MNEWNIQSRARICQGCEKTFEDKQLYHTLLFDEKRHYQRMDVCAACWTAQFSQGASDRKGFISYWHGIYHAPAAAQPEAIQKETAETLLRKLIEENDPAHRAAVYILAVMLERKRLLKVKEQVLRDHERIFIYEHPKTGDIFTVLDPNLQLDQLEEVQRDVAMLLEQGRSSGRDPAPVAEPTEPPTEERAALTRENAAVVH